MNEPGAGAAAGPAEAQETAKNTCSCCGNRAASGWLMLRCGCSETFCQSCLSTGKDALGIPRMVARIREPSIKELAKDRYHTSFEVEDWRMRGPSGYEMFTPEVVKKCWKCNGDPKDVPAEVSRRQQAVKRRLWGALRRAAATGSSVDAVTRLLRSRELSPRLMWHYASALAAELLDQGDSDGAALVRAGIDALRGQSGAWRARNAWRCATRRMGLVSPAPMQVCGAAARRDDPTATLVAVRDCDQGTNTLMHAPTRAAASGSQAALASPVLSAGGAAAALVGLGAAVTQGVKEAPASTGACTGTLHAMKKCRHAPAAAFKMTGQ